MAITKKTWIRISRFISMMKGNSYPNYPKFLKEMRKMDIAGTFKLSQKTLQRDVSYLINEYNAPIKYDYSRKGYYLTNSDWTWECPFFEPEEMKSALFGARLAETILQEPLRSEIRRAVDQQLMNNEKGFDEGVTLESLIVTINHRSPVTPEIFGTVFAAWEHHRTIRVDYRRAGGNEIKNFTVEPHVLTLFDGCWYIKGHLIAKGDWDCAEWGYPDMTLALQRITSAEILDTTFETDQRIVDDVANGRLFNMDEVYNVSLQVNGISSSYVKEQFPEKDWVEHDDGTLTLHIAKAIKLTLIKWILGEGGNVVVLTPKTLAEEVETQAANIVKEQSKHRLN
jgi:predicted DNA-binding transcriptional regulator YafY